MPLALVVYLSLLLTPSLNNYRQVLKAHVTDSGMVNYKKLHDKPEELQAYCNSLNSIDPAKLSRKAELALWMNAYNAYTLKVVLDHFPLKSIKDIEVGGKNAWDLPLAKVGGKTYTLNQIEHDILRPKFKDYRIHAGINCASFSCPILLNQPFTEANVDALLDEAFRGFVNDPQRNRISQNQLKLSSIFKWYAEDFEAAGGLKKVLAKYSETPFSESATIEYLPYNWSLNQQ